MICGKWKIRGNGSRSLITLVVAFWLAVAIGNWIAQHKDVQAKINAGDVTEEIKFAEHKRKPWRQDVSELQRQLDEENVGIRVDDNPVSVVTATPVVTSVATEVQNGSTDVGTSGSTQQEPAGEAKVSYGGAKTCFLQFASFSNESYARSLCTKLTVKGIDASLEAVTEGNTKLYRVRGGDYATREEAEMDRQKFAGIGFDSVVVNY